MKQLLKQEFRVTDEEQKEIQSMYVCMYYYYQNQEISKIIEKIQEKQVEGYELTEEQLARLFDEQMDGYNPGGVHEIKSLDDFLNRASQRIQIPLNNSKIQIVFFREIPFKYLWIGDTEYFFIFLIELPGGNLASKKYLLNVKEGSGQKKIVWQEFFTKAPTFSRNLQANSLLLFDRETSRLRVIFFSWNWDKELTEQVKEQQFILPEEVKVKSDYSSINEEQRESLYHNLQQKLKTQDSEQGRNERKEIKSLVSQVESLDCSQIVILKNDNDYDVVINAEKHGVIYFTIDDSDQDLKYMQMTDFKFIEDLKSEHNIVNALFEYYSQGSDCLVLMKDLSEDRLISFSIRKRNRTKEYKENKQFVIQEINPVLKIFNIVRFINLLDNTGSLIQINLLKQEKEKKNECCTEVFALGQVILSQSLVRHENNNSLQTQLSYRCPFQDNEQKNALDQTEALSKVFAKNYPQITAPLQFSQCLKIDNLVFLVQKQSIFVFNISTKQLISALSCEEDILHLNDEKNDHKFGEYTFNCITERSIKKIKLDINNGIEFYEEYSKKLNGEVLSICSELILTKEMVEECKQELKLYKLSSDQKLQLLLKDSSKEQLDHDSFFTLLRLPQNTVNPNESQNSLFCSTGSDKKLLTLYSLDSYEANNEEINETKEQQPIASKLREIAGLDNVNFKNEKILNFIEIKESKSVSNYILIKQNQDDQDSSVFIFDKEMKLANFESLIGIKINETGRYTGDGYLCALDYGNNLIAMDLNDLCKGNPPCKTLDLSQKKIITFLDNENENNLVFLSNENEIEIQTIQRCLLWGELKLEDSGFENEYLVWKQVEHIVSAVDVFNVVSFWNTRTGKLIHKVILDQANQIKDAFKFKIHQEQRYLDPNELFDCHTRGIISRVQDKDWNYWHKFIALNVFDPQESKFHAKCQIIQEFILDRFAQMFYNKDIDILIVSQAYRREIYYYMRDESKSAIHYKTTNEKDEGQSKFAGSHISPNGKYMLSFSDGIEIIKFEHSQDPSKWIQQNLTEWHLPIKKDDMNQEVLEKRIRFESNDMIRLVTLDNRDILYHLDSDGKTVHCLSHAKLYTSISNSDDNKHKLEFNEKLENKNGRIIQSSSRYLTYSWYKKIIEDQFKVTPSQTENDCFKKVDMNTPVRYSGDQLSVDLSFSVIDWAIAQAFVKKEFMPENFDFNINMKRRLVLNAFPIPEATVLHMIAASANIKDQSDSVALLKSLLYSSNVQDDHQSAQEEQLKITMLPNSKGLFPFILMEEKKLRVLIDSMIGLMKFSDVINSQDDVGHLLRAEDPNMIRFIETSLKENEYTQQFTSILIPTSTYLVTFRSQYNTLNQEEIQDMVEKSLQEKKVLSFFQDKKLKNTKIQLKIIDIRWLLSGKKSFLDFAPILGQFEKDKLFETEFVKSLTHEYWVTFLKKIIKKQFVPWLLYSALSITYFTNFPLESRTQYSEEGLQVTWLITELFMITLIIYKFYIEMKQATDDIKDYISSPYNYIDILQYFGTLVVVISNMAGGTLLNKIVKQNICIFVLLCQGLKLVLDWLRLFDNTSFYVTLIVRTIKDMVYFLIILLAIMFYFGIAVYMLQLTTDDGSETDIIAQTFDNFIVDSTLHQYLLILGNFDTEGFNLHDNPALCYTLFIVSTFFAQITILNMLIAIMSDTFDRVIEQKPTFLYQNKLSILKEMESLLRTNDSDLDAKVFLYVIQPVSSIDGEADVGESDLWRGKLHYTQSLIKSKFKDIKASNSAIKAEIKAVQLQQAEHKQQQNELKQQQNELKTEINPSLSLKKN